MAKGPANYKDFGKSLKDFRESKKKSMEDISEETRIREVYIEAMEKGEFSELPGLTYQRLYIKSYVEAIGGKSSEFLEQFDDIDETGKKPKKEEKPEPYQDSAAPSRKLVLISAAVVVVGLLILAAVGTGGSDKNAESVEAPATPVEAVEEAEETLEWTVLAQEPAIVTFKQGVEVVNEFVLQAGDVAFVAYTPDLSVTVENAEGIELFVSGVGIPFTELFEADDDTYELNHEAVLSHIEQAQNDN